MIELSGYTGKSANSVRDRLIASNELKSSKPAAVKKFKVLYSTQTLVTGNGFSIVEEGSPRKNTFEAEVNSTEEFEKFLIDLTVGKHKNPKMASNSGKYTIFSKIDENFFYVDILEFNVLN
jgi:hypothetical protein